LLNLLDKKDGSIIYKTYFNSILFIPISIFRLAAKGWRKILGKKENGTNSDHDILGTDGFFNNILSGIFKIDYYLLKWGFRFPAGVSILVFFKKN
ncbi:MAG: hypothetical protein WCL56_12820, partial [Sediminibacterium sp.]